MAVPATSQQAGPFYGDGIDYLVIPFTYRVFNQTDILVTGVNNGVYSTLTLGFDYSVKINKNQITTPGGTVTLLWVAPAGMVFYLATDIPFNQSLQLLSAGGQEITDALDWLAMQIKQVLMLIAACMSLPVGSGANLILPYPQANVVIGWDALGQNLTYYNPYSAVTQAQNVNFVQYGTGAGSRSVAAKFWEIVSVDDYYYSPTDTDDVAFQRAVNVALTFQFAIIELNARVYVLQNPITGVLRQHQFNLKLPGVYNLAQHLVIRGKGRDATLVLGNNTTGGLNFNFTNIYNNNSANGSLSDTPAITPTSSYSRIIDSFCTVTVHDFWLAPNLDGAGVGLSYNYLAQSYQDAYGYWNGQRIGHTLFMFNMRFDPVNADNSFFAWNTSIDVTGSLFPTFNDVLCGIGNYASTKQQSVLNVSNCYGARAFNCDFGSSSAAYGIYHVVDTIVEAVKFKDCYSVGPDIAAHFECRTNSRGDEYNIINCHFNGYINNVELWGAEDVKLNDNLLYRNTLTQMQSFTVSNAFIVGNQLYLYGNITGIPAVGMLVNGVTITAVNFSKGIYTCTLSGSATTTPSSSFTVTGAWSITNNILTITGSVTSGAIVAPTNSSTNRQFLTGTGIPQGMYIVCANAAAANSYILSSAISGTLSGSGLSGAAGIAISGSALFTATSWSISGTSLTLNGVVGTPANGQLISGSASSGTLNAYTLIASTPVNTSGSTWTATVSVSQTCSGGALSGGIANVTNDVVLAAITEAFTNESATVVNPASLAVSVLNVITLNNGGIVKQGQIVSGAGFGFTGTSVINGYINSFYAPSFSINGTNLTISGNGIVNSLQVGQLLNTSPTTITAGVIIPANTMVLSVSGKTAVLSNSIALCTGTGLKGTGGRGGVGTYLLDAVYTAASGTVSGTNTQQATNIEILDNTHGFGSAVYTVHRHVNMLDGSNGQNVTIRYKNLRARTVVSPFYVGNQFQYVDVLLPVFPQNNFISASYPMNDSGNPAYGLPAYQISAGAANVVFKDSLGNLLYSDSGYGAQWLLEGCTTGSPAIGTFYLGANSSQSGVNSTAFLVPAAATLKLLAVEIFSLPAAGNTLTFQAINNATLLGNSLAFSSTGWTCGTLSGSGTLAVIPVSISLTAGAKLAVKLVVAGAAATGNIQYSMLLAA